MKVLLVDDVQNVLDYISSVILEKHNDWILDTATSFEDAIKLADTNIYDLFILDYELDVANPNKNGLNLGLTLKSKAEYIHTPMIFETSYPEHIYEATNKLNCIYYLLKPYDKSDLLQMIDKISYIPMKNKYIILKDVSGISFRIKIDDIIFIKSDRHRLIITTTSDIIITPRNTFADFSDTILIRCHKSYMINPDYIIARDKTLSSLTLTDPKSSKNHHIPIGEKYTNNIDERMAYKI